MTECTQSQFPFEAHFSRQVVERFGGCWQTTDGGALLLREADRKIALLRRVTRCFTDHRDPQRLEHGLGELLAQRIYGLALGDEDLNDHEELRHDLLLAGKSTLNRLELVRAGWAHTERYHKITYSAEALDRLLVKIFLEAHRQPPQEIVLDLDATDTPLHGQQEARFFHAWTTCLASRATSGCEGKSPAPCGKPRKNTSARESRRACSRSFSTVRGRDARATLTMNRSAALAPGAEAFLAKKAAQGLAAVPSDST